MNSSKWAKAEVTVFDSYENECHVREMYLQTKFADTRPLWIHLKHHKWLYWTKRHLQRVTERHPKSPCPLYGQELEPETHAVCPAGMLFKTLETDTDRDLSKNIKLGSTLSADKNRADKFHYCVSNPPFRKKWEMDQTAVTREHKEQKFEGRFGPKLPRVSDGSMLFLLHLLSKMESPKNGGGRAAVILSGSPLFNGNAGQGESEIRRHLLEQDVVEAIITLPIEIFFRTDIGTNIWILSNKNPAHRKGKVQLINATDMFEPMRKSEGNKRRSVAMSGSSATRSTSTAISMSMSHPVIWMRLMRN